MRALIQQLRPSPVEEGGLASALHKHLTALERREGLKVGLQVEGEGQLPREQEEGLFRIVQEALNNVVKHAQTDKAAVRLQLEDGRVSLLIEDQGAGFDPSVSGSARGGFGLTSMRERIEMLGGALEVKSSPRKGTQVLVQVPQTKGGKSNGQN
jgi:signal transduction histidine kinase